MRVVAIQADGEPGLESRAAEPPAAGGLLLRTIASGLCGTDLYKLTARSAAPGAVLGHEIVGETIAVGEGVRDFELGDRIVVPHHVSCGRCRLCVTGAETQCAEFAVNQLLPGGFADEIRVAASATRLAARRIPEPLSDLDALFLEPAACVLRSVDRSGLAEIASQASGRSLALVLGGGSMGLLHLLVIRALEIAADVVVVDPREDRRKLARELGAQEAYVPDDPAIAKLGADAVFDCVGGAGLVHSAIEALRPGGTAVLFAHARPAETPAFELNDLFKHEKRLVGAYSGSLSEQQRVFALLAGGALRPAMLVTHRLPLADFARGVELARRQEALKVVFHP